MPLLKLQISAALSDEKREDLLKALSKAVAEAIEKPEKYVMVTIKEADIIMSGEVKAAAFADVRSIGGLNSKVNNQLSQKISSLLKGMLGISADRVYITFTDVSPCNWGWNGSTFG